MTTNFVKSRYEHKNHHTPTWRGRCATFHTSIASEFCDKACDCFSYAEACYYLWELSFFFIVKSSYSIRPTCCSRSLIRPEIIWGLRVAKNHHGFHFCLKLDNDMTDMSPNNHAVSKLKPSKTKCAYFVTGII